MDLNPCEFKDMSKFELAEFCKKENIDALFFIAAWNDHEPENNSPDSSYGIVNYWLHRMSPLVNKY